MSATKSFRTRQAGSDPAAAFAAAQARIRAELGTRADDPETIRGTILAKTTFEVVTPTPRPESTAKGLAGIWAQNERFGGTVAGAIPLHDGINEHHTVAWLFAGGDYPI